MQRISSNTSRWVGKTSKGDPEKFDSELEYDPLEQIRRERIEAVTGWRNFLDAEGQQMKCNSANKSAWLDFDPELGKDETGKAKRLSEWIDQFRKNLADETPSTEELEKN